MLSYRIQFLNVLGAGWSPSAALLPPLPHRAICCYGRASLNCQPVTYIPPLRRLTRRLRGRSVCVPMSSIRINQVLVFTQYRRCSLSYDIVAMCGWRLISRYRLIDIIPKNNACKSLHLQKFSYIT